MVKSIKNLYVKKPTEFHQESFNRKNQYCEDVGYHKANLKMDYNQ